MPRITLKFSAENKISGVVKKILNRFPEQKIFAFFGELGAGKTTLIKEFCRQLGVQKNQATSPTFTLINEYRSSKNFPVFHFDFYRIKNENEIFDLGYEDYFYSGNYCFIEWAEKIPNLLPQYSVILQIKVEKEERILVVSA